MRQTGGLYKVVEYSPQSDNTSQWERTWSAGEGDGERGKLWGTRRDKEVTDYLMEPRKTLYRGKMGRPVLSVWERQMAQLSLPNFQG